MANEWKKSIYSGFINANWLHSNICKSEIQNCKTMWPGHILRCGLDVIQEYMDTRCWDVWRSSWEKETFWVHQFGGAWWDYVLAKCWAKSVSNKKWVQRKIKGWATKGVKEGITTLRGTEENCTNWIHSGSELQMFGKTTLISCLDWWDGFKSLVSRSCSNSKQEFLPHNRWSKNDWGVNE